MSGRTFPQPFEPYENHGRWPNAGNPAYTAGGHAPPQQGEFSVLHDAVDWTLSASSVWPWRVFVPTDCSLSPSLPSLRSSRVSFAPYRVLIPEPLCPAYGAG